MRQNGFVDLTVALRTPDPCDARCPAEYAALTRGARRLTLDFRFRDGSLDSRAFRDLDRLTAFLRGSSASRLMLFGFGDDEARSLERARTAALELERRGVKAEGVKGFGAALPVGPADDEAGRRRNRRVEVWLKEGF